MGRMGSFRPAPDPKGVLRRQIATLQLRRDAIRGDDPDAVNKRALLDQQIEDKEHQLHCTAAATKKVVPKTVAV